MKKRISKLILFALIFVLSACQLEVENEQQPFMLSLSEDVSIELPSLSRPSHTETIDKIHAVDDIYVFDVEGGTFTITKRVIDEDTMLFFEAVQTGERPLHIPYTMKTATETYSFHPFAQPIVEEHHDVFGIDYTTNLKGYVQSDAGEWHDEYGPSFSRRR